MFNNLYKKCLNLAAHKSSKYYLAIVSFVESSFFPIPPDVMIIPMVISKKNDFIKIFLITTIFSVLGGVLGYLIGAFFFDFGSQIMSFYGYENKLSNIKEKIIDGYVQIGKTKFIPDSILITGPKIELDKTLGVFTTKDTLNDLNKIAKGEIDLLAPNRLIKYSSKKVKYLFDIQQISERIIVDIPISVINKIKGIRVFPSPQTVSTVKQV